MKEIKMEELKSLQLDILKNVRDFCNKNDITYFLAFGTLLGAIRHKGYIPWDDDIDIMMPRNDYDRFIRTFNGTFSHLEVKAPDFDSCYFAPFANVCDNRTLLIEPYIHHQNVGVKIDVFPIDFVPNSKSDYDKICNRSAKLNNIRDAKVAVLSYYKGDRWLKYFVKKLIYSLISISRVQRQIIKLASQTFFLNSDYVDVIVFRPYLNSRFLKSVLDSKSEAIFESEKFTIPQDYDSCLKAIYGNYLQLPPVEKRVGHHYFSAFWK